MDGCSYLSNAKEPVLPHGFSCVVVQVLIIVSCNDGRKLLQGILRILTEEEGWFFSDEDRAHYEALALSWAKRNDQLLGLNLQPHDGFGYNFGLLWKIVSLLWLLPLGRQVGRTCLFRALTFPLFFL